MRFRSQKFTTGAWKSESWVYNNPKTLASGSFVNDKNITDDIHKWPDRKTTGLKDIGGTLYQEIFSIADGAHNVKQSNGGFLSGAWAYNYTGPQFAWQKNVPYSTTHNIWAKSAGYSNSELDAAGTTAISRCAPTNPHASLSQTLGEFRRDGIPSMVGLQAFRRGPRPRAVVGSAGREYLNVEFGWKPLLNDIRKLATAQKNSERVLKQYVRDSGGLVRRRYEFPSTEETLSSTSSAGYYPTPSLVSAHYVLPAGGYILTDVATVSRRKWFSGAFTYHVDQGEDFLAKAHRSVQEANHLLGLGLTPGVLWDLTPWSWAADWVTNTGDVLNNLSMSMSDGLVVVYGYIMAETVTTRVLTLKGVQFRQKNVAQPPLDLVQTFTHTVRQRRRATPFGFGLNLEAFTPRQLAIVAALAVSRDGRNLAI